ncbi:hypothetical protein C7M84_016177 [Penaeus vannamei]|uniref:Uncharacterized protein n=1 Tax=Penaeus vannamei TaxID=6689 RepID=A0A423SNS3_PENVA|nr:hypothetical protein C7M84_016177 [Penaeus vannamei]
MTYVRPNSRADPVPFTRSPAQRVAYAVQSLVSGFPPSLPLPQPCAARAAAAAPLGSRPPPLAVPVWVVVPLPCGVWACRRTCHLHTKREGPAAFSACALPVCAPAQNWARLSFTGLGALFCVHVCPSSLGLSLPPVWRLPSLLRVRHVLARRLVLTVCPLSRPSLPCRLSRYSPPPPRPPFYFRFSRPPVLPHSAPAHPGPPHEARPSLCPPFVSPSSAPSPPPSLSSLPPSPPPPHRPPLLQLPRFPVAPFSLPSSPFPLLPLPSPLPLTGAPLPTPPSLVLLPHRPPSAVAFPDLLPVPPASPAHQTPFTQLPPVPVFLPHPPPPLPFRWTPVTLTPPRFLSSFLTPVRDPRSPPPPFCGPLDRPALLTPAASQSSFLIAPSLPSLVSSFLTPSFPLPPPAGSASPLPLPPPFALLRPALGNLEF